jgi:hypothetical protein
MSIGSFYQTSERTGERRGVSADRLCTKTVDGLVAVLVGAGRCLGRVARSRAMKSGESRAHVSWVSGPLQRIQEAAADQDEGYELANMCRRLFAYNESRRQQPSRRRRSTVGESWSANVPQSHAGHAAG